jgi:hypothetical protein
MAVPNDELSRIEMKGIEHARARDWENARTCFREVLTHEMPAVRRIEALANLAGTYASEQNREETEKVLEEAWRILDEQTEGPAYLRRRLNQTLGYCNGTTVGIGWTAVFTVAGAYFAISFLSGARLAWGAPLNGPAVILLALLPALMIGASNAGQLLWNWLVGTAKLLASFAVGFGIGYTLFVSGVLQFGYRGAP